MPLVKPFGFLAAAAAGGVVTEDILYYYNGSTESIGTTVDTWIDIGGVNNLNLVTGGSDSPGTAIFDGKEAFQFDSTVQYLNGTVNTTETIYGYSVDIWLVYDGGNPDPQDKGTLFQLMWYNFDQSNAFYTTLGTSGANQGKMQAYVESASSNKGHHPASTAVTNNVWQHVAVTIEPGSTGNLKFYTNGSPDGSYNVPWSSLDLNSNGNYENRVGEQKNGERQYSGYIGVIRAYKKTLSADEVLQNYNAGVI